MQTSISIEQVITLLSDEGYDIDFAGDGDLASVVDLETGLRVQLALQEDVLFCCLPLVAEREIGADAMRRMLDAENGISSSFFQISTQTDGRTLISLNNFAKLQNCGHDDQDDIAFCIESLVSDAIEAKDLLADVL